jgi:hypothetical protein
MEIRSSLWHGTPSSGPVGGAHRRLSVHRKSPRSARARVLRGILVLALALGSSAAVAAGAMAHSTGHPHGGVASSNHWMY